MDTAVLEKPEAKADEVAKAAPDFPQTQEFVTPKISRMEMLKLFYKPEGTLRLTIERNPEGWENFSYPTVKLYQAAPLSSPGRYIVLHDGKGEEITMSDHIDQFSPDSRAIAEDEIRRRYLTAKIQSVTSIKVEFGITYWTVLTDKGERDFVVQSLTESCIWLSDRHLLIIDVDGNRFEILDRFSLDETSRTNLALVL
jgi:hypothetical protein